MINIKSILRLNLYKKMGQCLCKNNELKSIDLIKNEKIILNENEIIKQKLSILNDENTSLKKQIENKNKQINKLTKHYTNDTIYLKFKDNYNLEYREKDDYINITNIYNFSRKEYNNWFNNKKTNLFLEKLKTIYETEIIKNEDKENLKQIWVHPLVAIDMSQYISLEIYFLVNKWIFENISNKIYKNTLHSINSDINEENKILKNRIKLLENKVLQKQPREIFDENKNVVYVVTTESKKSQGHYKIGKAQDLQKRLSTYNTTDKHEVIYNTSCKTKRKMDLLEQIVHDRLDSKRIEQNREWFISEEEGKDFIKIIEECKQLVDR